MKFHPRLFVTAWKHHNITGFAASTQRNHEDEIQYVSMAEVNHLLKEREVVTWGQAAYYIDHNGQTSEGAVSDLQKKANEMWNEFDSEEV